MLAKLEVELSAVEGARSDAQLTELDAAGLVDYAIHVVMNAGTLWRDVGAEHRLQLQVRVPEILAPPVPETLALID